MPVQEITQPTRRWITFHRQTKKESNQVTHEDINEIDAKDRTEAKQDDQTTRSSIEEQAIFLIDTHINQMVSEAIEYFR